MNNADTVRGIYAAFGRGEIPAILERLAENVEWEHDATDHGIALLVPRRGRAEVVKFFEALGALEFSRFEVEQVFDGGAHVAAVVRVGHRHKRTGRAFADLEMHLWGFDARGRVVAFRHFVDTHQLWVQQGG